MKKMTTEIFTPWEHLEIVRKKVKEKGILDIDAHGFDPLEVMKKKILLWKWGGWFLIKYLQLVPN